MKDKEIEQIIADFLIDNELMLVHQGTMERVIPPSWANEWVHEDYSGIPTKEYKTLRGALNRLQKEN